MRPTSETIIGAMYAKWVESYRDLPILINQWCNVVRWELRTRMFLRTAEFLWQEGHTAHATEAEAREETMKMLDVYADFAETEMAMPVIKGEKTAGERFPGAVATYSIEAMMQDRKALQAGTSHFLGQNFSRAQEIKFQDAAGGESYAWTTSWGVSTRLVGALLMTHSDDDGLVLPPRLAPKHVVILPIYRGDDDRAKVREYCDRLAKELESATTPTARSACSIDDRDLRGGEKAWQHIKRGVPLRAEIGPRDIEKDAVFLARRDTGTKEPIGRQQLIETAPQILTQIQNTLFERALKLREENTLQDRQPRRVQGLFHPEERGEARDPRRLRHCATGPRTRRCTSCLKDLKVTIRCVPLDAPEEAGPLHLHRQAEHQAGDLREGVLKSLHDPLNNLRVGKNTHARSKESEPARFWKTLGGCTRGPVAYRRRVLRGRRQEVGKKSAARRSARLLAG